MSQIISAVVVTWNRKKMLMKCLDSIISQSMTPNRIYIVDNYSSDGTEIELFDNNYISEMPSKDTQNNQYFKSTIKSNSDTRGLIDIIYIRKYKNDGGSGGFYEGLKTACKDNSDWIWMMDDDGLPDVKQLEMLYRESLSRKILFSNALVLNIDAPSLLAFGLGEYTKAIELENHTIVKDAANLFNGTFINRVVPETIGYIKKEMFIWGDENEYYLRALNRGYIPHTIVKAIHFHPPSKTITSNIIPLSNKYQVELKPKKRMGLFLRNKVYILKVYYPPINLFSFMVKYTAYYMLRLRIISLFVLFKSFYQGIFELFPKD